MTPIFLPQCSPTCRRYVMRNMYWQGYRSPTPVAIQEIQCVHKDIQIGHTASVSECNFNLNALREFNWSNCKIINSNSVKNKIRLNSTCSCTCLTALCSFHFFLIMKSKSRFVRFILKSGSKNNRLTVLVSLLILLICRNTN